MPAGWRTRPSSSGRFIPVRSIRLAKIDLADGRTEEALAGFEKLLALERATGTPLAADLKALALNSTSVSSISNVRSTRTRRRRSRPRSGSPPVTRAPGSTSPWPAWRSDAESRGWTRCGGRTRSTAPTPRSRCSSPAPTRRPAAGSSRGAPRRSDRSPPRPPTPLARARPRAARSRQRGRRRNQSAAGARERPGQRRRRRLSRGPPARRIGDLPQRLRGGGSDAAAATRFEPENGTAWAILGRAQQGAGDLAAAATSLARALEVEPGRADFAYNLGTVYLAQNRFADAENLFDRALTLDPEAREPASPWRDSRRCEGRPHPGGAGPPRGPGTADRASSARARGAPRAGRLRSLGIRGLIVQAVTKGSLAARAGLEIDDLVLRGDGQPLTQVPTLMALVRNPEAKSLQLSVLRSGRPVEIVLPLD
ncbi:MAG: tetratricopeptide repeat protein [Thermoanaerobaculia bacterium]